MLDHLQTESRHPDSTHLDEMTALEIVRLMNREDGRAVEAVASQADQIARAIEIVADRLGHGGRLIYVGAGTSGRLGVLDAAECPPTFNSPPEQVVGVIAGGPEALTRSVEGAEDHPDFGERDLRAFNVNKLDVVVGIATSGRTPFVLGAMEYARSAGAMTIGLACNTDSELQSRVELMILPIVGPEILSGSTRLKAGTATKLVLNMISTGAMVTLGKCFGNLMVDLRATNAKLRARTNRIVRLITDLDKSEADQLLNSCGGELKTALVSHLTRLTPEQARARLHECRGRIQAALEAQGFQPERLINNDIVLGVDGGGSSTVALLAERGQVIGRGEAGPSNIRAVGTQAAFQALDAAIRAAFSAAQRPCATVQAACLGLAGAGRMAEREQIESWAKSSRIACSIQIVTDVELVLSAGAPNGVGIALVAGTGSIAFGRAPDRRTTRAGGWGRHFGDEGSGYALVIAALRAVTQSIDGRGPPTTLGTLLTDPSREAVSGLTPPIYRMNPERPFLAKFAPQVLAAAEAGDAQARQIVESGADQLSAMVAACAHSLKLERPPLALSGGLLINSEYYRNLVLAAIARRGLAIESSTVVEEPALGALKLISQVS
jgi:N-acetylmuramic acid 6-phosphate etherase